MSTPQVEIHSKRITDHVHGCLGVQFEHGHTMCLCVWMCPYEFVHVRVYV
jgi:hypothetical protein